MTMQPDRAGSVELPRSILLTPAWDSQTAWRIFSWLLLSATRYDRQESVHGHVLQLRRGQIAVSQLEIGRSTGLSRKSVQTALRLLEIEGFLIRDTVCGGHAAIYTVRTGLHEHRETAPLSGGGATAGALVRAVLEQHPEPSFITDNSQCSNRVDNDEHCPGIVPGAVNRPGAGTDRGA